jgi:uncharacterized protein YigE (DUF2233 family)
MFDALRVAFVVAVTLLVGGRVAQAVECRRVTVAGKAATACRVDLAHEELRLLLAGPDGRPLHTLAAAEGFLAHQGRRVLVAMNAGMFHPSYAPVGLLIQDGKTVAPLNRATGQGNFFLLPNGVFLVGPAGAAVRETSEVAALKGPIAWATQSGPLLVRAGKIHAQLRPQSTSRLIRNGVGVDGKGRVELVISDEPVSFWELATLFRDVLGCADALYFDGTVSSVSGPAVGRSVQRADLGPIIVVVAR